MTPKQPEKKAFRGVVPAPELFGARVVSLGMWDARASEGTSVIPYASIEAVPAVAAGVPLLLEATLLWGRDTLGVRHLAARGAVRVCDLALDVPGCDELVLGDVNESGTFRLRLPNGTLVPEACRMTLRMGRTMLRVALVADDAVKLPPTLPSKRIAFGIALAAVLHVTVLGLMSHARVDEGASEQAARETMQRMVASAADRASLELAATPEKSRIEPGISAPTPDKEQAGAGNPSNVSEKAARLRITKGETRHADKPGREEVSTFGLLSLLATARDEQGAHAGSSAFAAESGPSAMGNIFGQTIDDAAGMGGLGLTGPGQGAGGLGAGVKLGSIGTLGHASGMGDAKGFGAGAIAKPREHVAGTYSLVWGGGSGTQVNGRLPPESIQRVVRQSFGRLRGCYAAGLEKNPDLEGRVSVKFVIDREGQVALASPWSDTTLPDASVARCVTRAYQAMTFPKPEGGIVTVVYPVVFTRTSP